MNTQPANSEVDRTDDAPRELNRLDVLRGLRIATWEAAFATVWASLTTGAFLTGFALWLGAKDLEIAFLTAIPTFAGLVQLLSSYFGERLSARKPFTAWFSLAGRGLWLPILLLPFLLGKGHALVPFLLLFLLSYICLNVPAPAYMSWMSDLVPPDHRGRYFARRNMLAGMVGMVCGLPAAWFLDYMARRAHQEAFGFAVLFGIGVAGGIASFICLLRQPEPPKRIAPPSDDTPQGLAGVLNYYRAPFADRNFRRLITFNVVLGLGQFFAAPFFMVYALKELGLNYVQLQFFATLTALSSLASMPLWGYLADKFGNKPLLAIGTFGTFTLPLYWICTQKGNPTLMLVLITVNHLMGGASWAGVGLTQFNLLIRLSPPEKTAVYVATMAAVTGLTGGLVPLLGGVLMRALEGWESPLLGLMLKNFHVAFFVAAILRLTSLLFLRPLVDSQAASARDVLQQLTRADPRAWLNIRRLQQGRGMETRLRATEALGESRTQLAVDELKAALHDPSLAVREEAARALGEIGDSTAVETLIEALRDPAAGITEAAATALGRIGDHRAVPPLIALLTNGEGERRKTKGERENHGEHGGYGEEDINHRGHGGTQRDSEERRKAEGESPIPEHQKPKSDTRHPTPDTLNTRTPEHPTPFLSGLERLAVIGAIGRLGGAEAAETMCLLLEKTEDVETAEALARALGEAGESEAVPVLTARLEQEASRGLRLVIVRSLGALGDEAAIPALRRELERGRDDAALLPAVADALALLEDSGSVSRLVASLAETESPLARKQVAVALGGLIGEREGLYSLLSQEDFARDAAVSRLIQELQRRMRGSEVEQSMEELLSAYVGEDYTGCIRILQEAANTLAVSEGDVKVQALRDSVPVAETVTPPVELVLVSLVALRGLLSE